MMRFYTQQHRFYCGIDLHARLLAVCIVDQTGAIVYQKQLPADPQVLLEALARVKKSGLGRLVVSVSDGRIVEIELVEKVNRTLLEAL
jgi:predicted NBD/HSP70 family sugar kinase